MARATAQPIKVQPSRRLIAAMLPMFTTFREAPMIVGSSTGYDQQEHDQAAKCSTCRRRSEDHNCLHRHFSPELNSEAAIRRTTVRRPTIAESAPKPEAHCARTGNLETDCAPRFDEHLFLDFSVPHIPFVGATSQHVFVRPIALRITDPVKPQCQAADSSFYDLGLGNNA